MSALDADRIPPHNLEAEEAVIGAVMIDRHRMTEARAIIQASDFYAHGHGLLWKVLLDLDDRGAPLDKVTVSEELRRRKVDGADLFEKVGGLPHLNSLLAASPTAQSVEYYAKIVHEKSELRGLIHAASVVADMGYEGTDATATIESAKQYLASATATRSSLNGHGGQRKCSWVSLTEAEIVGLNIAPPSFDVEGLLPKEDGPTLVFGPPEAGKSWLTMHLCRCLASGDLFLGRLAVNRYPEVVYINMDAGAHTTQRRFQRLASGRAPLKNYHLYCVDEFDAAEMARLFEKHQGAFVVIDCLADFFHADRTKDQAEGMRSFVRGLRGLYERNKCNGIVLDHPHRPKDGVPGDYYGSIQKEASFRSMWLVQSLPIEDKSTRSLKVTCRKMNDGERFLPFVVKIVFSSDAITFTHEGELEPSGSSIAVTPDFQQVEALLVGIPPPGLSQATISARLSWARLRTLAAIKASTKIVSSGGSKNRRYHLRDSVASEYESTTESETQRKVSPIRSNIQLHSVSTLGVCTNATESEATFEGADPSPDSVASEYESTTESFDDDEDRL
jgi:hypothetical protein